MDGIVDRRSKSLWMDVADDPRATSLQGDNECDVVIVGAGIAGISTAYELAIEGSHVIVLDRGKIAGGITARTSAHLAPLCDDLTSAMISLRGEEMSRLFYQSQAAAVDRIEEIPKRESIECDFRRLDGYLFQALNTNSKIIEDELEAVRKVGAPVHRLVGVPLAHCEQQHVLRYPRQATFHPLKYLKGLVAAIEAKGGSFHSDTVVERFEERDNGKVVVKAGGGTITARAAIVAPMLQSSIDLPCTPKSLPIAPTRWPFRFRRSYSGRPVLGHARPIPLCAAATGRRSHRFSHRRRRRPQERRSRRRRSPLPGPRSLDAQSHSGREGVTHRWSGQVLDTIDYAGFIGKNPGNNNIYVHTGDSGQGMTHGSWAR